jgi:hypothetical protein
MKPNMKTFQQLIRDLRENKILQKVFKIRAKRRRKNVVNVEHLRGFFSTLQPDFGVLSEKNYFTAGLLYILLPVALLVGFAMPAAAANLTVEFDPDPLFSESNALPGDTSQPIATVTNHTDQTQAIYIGATNVIDDDGLSSYIDLTIESDNSQVWSGTFADLFAVDEIYLSDLGPGQTVQYDFTARFRSEAGNETQTAMLGFDIWLGLWCTIK